jgi:hypothetical protein
MYSKNLPTNISNVLSTLTTGLVYPEHGDSWEVHDESPKQSDPIEAAENEKNLEAQAIMTLGTLSVISGLAFYSVMYGEQIAKYSIKFIGAFGFLIAPMPKLGWKGFKATMNYLTGERVYKRSDAAYEQIKTTFKLIDQGIQKLAPNIKRVYDETFIQIRYRFTNGQETNELVQGPEEGTFESIERIIDAPKYKEKVTLKAVHGGVMIEIECEGVDSNGIKYTFQDKFVAPKILKQTPKTVIDAIIEHDENRTLDSTIEKALELEEIGRNSPC